MAGRKYCKNTVPGRQGRGKKYPAAVRAEVVMAMIGSNSICAVARKYGVPESTIRSWMAEEAGKPDSVFAKARAEAAREIAARAALGARAQIGYLQQRVAENQRAAEVRAKLHQRLDEDARARDFALGSRLKSEDEALADATETGLVVYASPGSYDRRLEEEERKALVQQLERYDSMTMSDKDAANVAAVLLTAVANAAALVPDTDRDSRPERPGGADGAKDRGRAAGGSTGWQRDGIRADPSCGRPQPRQRAFMARCEDEALYGGAAGRRKERRAGDRGTAAGGCAELSGTDPAQDISAAAGADRQDDAVLQARLPQGKVQLLGALLDVSQRGEDLFRIHVPRAG